MASMFAAWVVSIDLTPMSVIQTHALAFQWLVIFMAVTRILLLVTFTMFLISVYLVCEHSLEQFL